jgi:hypothetical protein
MESESESNQIMKFNPYPKQFKYIMIIQTNWNPNQTQIQTKFKSNPTNYNKLGRRSKGPFGL